MKWINALGLLLQFISFWLAAPEILGEKALIRISSGLKKLVSNLSMAIVLLIILGYGLTFSIGGIMKGLEASRSGSSIQNDSNFLISMGIATFLYFIFIFRYKKIRLFIDTKISGPLIEMFVKDEQIRKNSLWTGAVLFTTGFIIQFLIILLTD
ncbi:MAG TPA: hypothetical protein PKD91_14480 [Bacteroidia bacterium]|nr:hypothetical protein [Bacteroidia bacterium]